MVTITYGKKLSLLGKIAKMNWIIYLSFSIAKLLIISSLALLAFFVLPIIFMIFSFGLLLSYLRDIEPNFYGDNALSNPLEGLTLNNLKSLWFIIFPQIVSRLQYSVVHLVKPQSSSKKG
jgi:hypothetical protein